MKKSSSNGLVVVNWTIPAFMSKTGLKTCPNAGLCAIGCYARSGTYSFSNVKSAHEKKLELTQKDQFVDLMINEIKTWLKKKSVNHLKVRIHDAGDFYSLDYLNKWIEIMEYFEKIEKGVSFYAYTKQVEMIKSQKDKLPSNFRVIFSFGGKQDSLIDVNTDFHSKVFESLEQLEQAHYANGTENDLVAANGLNNKIGLVYHGTKSYTNTKWGAVS